MYAIITITPKSLTPYVPAHTLCQYYFPHHLMLGKGNEQIENSLSVDAGVDTVAPEIGLAQFEQELRAALKAEA